jgi:hypothetical protein
VQILAGKAAAGTFSLIEIKDCAAVQRLVEEPLVYTFITQSCEDGFCVRKPE